MTKILRILLAEDNPVNQKLIAQVLKNAGHDVDLAGDGETALKLYQTQFYDVVLMDVEMPVLDGLAALKEIRKFEMRVKRRTPIIALTAHTENADQDHFLEAGMDDCVCKPIDFEELKQKLYKVLET